MPNIGGGEKRRRTSRASREESGVRSSNSNSRDKKRQKTRSNRSSREVLEKREERKIKLEKALAESQKRKIKKHIEETGLTDIKGIAEGIAKKLMDININSKEELITRMNDEDVQKIINYDVYNNLKKEPSLINIKKKIEEEQLKNFKNTLRADKKYITDVFRSSQFKNLNNIRFYEISEILALPGSSTLRKMMNDYMSLLRTDYSGVKKSIDFACQDNFTLSKERKDGQICYCCGKLIKKGEKKACDHLIPVTTMLIVLKGDKSINNNLHYIHSSCNGKKSDDNICKFYNEAGGNKYNEYSRDSRYKIKCQNRIKEILNELEFRKPEDMELRLDRLKKVLEYFTKIKEQVALLSDIQQEALVTSALFSIAQQDINLGRGKKLTKKKKSKK